MKDPKQGWSAEQATWNGYAKTAAVLIAIGVSLYLAWGYFSDRILESNARDRGSRLQREKSESAKYSTTMANGPSTKTWSTPEGTLVEIIIPVDRYKVGVLELQRCIVWRDAKIAAVQLYCDPEAIPGE